MMDENILQNRQNLITHLSKSKSNLINELNSITSLAALYEIKSKFTGKESNLHLLLGQIKNLKMDEKIEIGKLLNQTKIELLDLIKNEEEKLISLQPEFNVNNNIFLMTEEANFGSKHPVMQIFDELKTFLSYFNFKNASSCDVDDDWHNFGALNFKDNHPARQMHDTFYLDYKNLILRTHTSNTQVRFMSQNKPPFKFYSFGRVYRKDSDRTHTPMFHQMEIVLVDKNVSIANLIWFVKEFLKYCFGSNLIMRFRPNYFPFTSPSIEVDIKLNGKWMEILGCGMIHKNVFKNTGIDSEIYSGFAIGIGIDRLAMIKYNIQDLRQMFESDYNFISQYNLKVL